MPGWSQTVGSRLVRTRRGSRVHLELARPWFLTGEGETLGVLAVNDVLDFATAPPVELRPFTSQVARDAVYDGIGQPPEFPDRWVTGRMLPGFGDPSVVTVTDVPSGALAAVRGYDVSYARRPVLRGRSDRRRCRSPVLPDGPAGGRPVPAREPRRTLVVARRQDRLHPAAAGPRTRHRAPCGGSAGHAQRPRPDERRRPAQPGRRLSRTTGGARGRGRRNGRARPIGADAGGVPAWVRMPGSAVSGGLGAPVGILAVPSLPDRVRLVVKEVERFFVDDFGTVPEPTPGGELSERIVFDGRRHADLTRVRPTPTLPSPEVALVKQTFAHRPPNA